MGLVVGLQLLNLCRSVGLDLATLGGLHLLGDLPVDDIVLFAEIVKLELGLPPVFVHGDEGINLGRVPPPFTARLSQPLGVPSLLLS